MEINSLSSSGQRYPINNEFSDLKDHVLTKLFIYLGNHDPDEGLKEIIKENVESSCAAGFESRGIKPGDFPTVIKSKLEDNKRRYIDRMFEVFKNYYLQHRSVTLSYEKMMEEGVKWMQTEDQKDIDDLLAQFKLSTNKRFLRKVEIKQRMRVSAAKITVKKMKVTIDAFQNIIDKVARKVKLAEERRCSPAEISDAMIEEQNQITEKQREALINELIEQDNKTRAAKKNKNRRPNKKNQRKRTTPTKSTENKSSSKLEITNKKNNNDTKVLSAYAKDIYKRNPKLHYRVKRWSSLKDCSEIRSFKDILPDGKEVFKYKNLSDKDIQKQWIRHDLVGTEKLIADKQGKKIYSFPTNLGCGIMTELLLENEKEYGIIYFGIGDDGVIYHRYFEKIEDPSSLEIFRDKKSDLFEADDFSDDEGWQNAARFEITVLKDGIVHIKYPERKCSLNVFPINKTLFHETLRSKDTL